MQRSLQSPCEAGLGLLFHVQDSSSSPHAELSCGSLIWLRRDFFPLASVVLRSQGGALDLCSFTVFICKNLSRKGLGRS